MVDEFELLRAWRMGDSAAGSRLLRQHVDMLYHFFAARVGETNAEELTQSTFEVCAKSRDKLKGEGSIRAYLLAIARNKLLQHRDEWRRRGSRHQPMEASVAGYGPSVTSVVAGREQQRVIVAALRRLPLDFQLAIELHYWEDLSVVEVAQVLAISPGTVKSRMHRARAMLREAIDELAQSEALAASATQGLDTWIASLDRHRENAARARTDG